MADEASDFDFGEVVVLQHAPQCDPAALAPVLDARAGRRSWRLLDVAGGDPYPDLERARGVVVLGGPMGVPDADEYPWMGGELALLRDAVDRAIPVFGICLGAQLLGAALGGRVERRPVAEIAFVPLLRTEPGTEDTVFAGWPDGARALLFHEDEVVELPDGAVAMLTGSDGTPAWRTSDGLSYGVQFHPEVDAAHVAMWCESESSLAAMAGAGVDPAALVEATLRRERFTLAVGLSLLGRWLDGVVGRDDPAPPRRTRAAA